MSKREIIKGLRIAAKQGAMADRRQWRGKCAVSVATDGVNGALQIGIPNKGIAISINDAQARDVAKFFNVELVVKKKDEADNV